MICGPTGAGKSAIAMWLSTRAACTVVVADSRQVYRQFDVGTAKPSPAEQRRVPHRGLDVVDATDRYSAAAWAHDADRWITDAEALGHTPVVVGGTGLYLRALFEPFFEEPPIDPNRRRELQRVLAALPSAELARWVRVLDPERSPLGRSQLLRAIEIALLSGHRLSSLHRERARPARRAARYLVVDQGPALGGLILDRLDTMLAGGWVEEVRMLMREIPEDAPAWKSTGYRTLRQLAQGALPAAAARDAIWIETRQYAKRQRTWFRHQLPPDVMHVDPLAPDAHAIVERWWASVAGAEARSR